MQNSWVIFHGFSSPVIAVMIIFFNSVAIYKMVKPKLRVKLIKNNAKDNNARLHIMETALQKTEDTLNKRENSTENKQIKEQTANKYEAMQSRASGSKKKIAECIVLLINLAISDLVVGIDVILAKSFIFHKHEN